MNADGHRWAEEARRCFSLTTTLTAAMLALLLGWPSIGVLPSTFGHATDTGASQDADDSGDEAPTRELPDSAEVPVVYSPYFDPVPLTPEQQAAVIQIAAEAWPEEADFWFIYVRYHRDNRYRVKVYFTPTEASPAVRKGQYTGFDNALSLRQRREFLRRLGEAPSSWPNLSSYVQAARAGRPLEEELSTPEPAEMPFPAVPTLLDEELVSLVQFVRATIPPHRRLDPMPIMQIKRVDNGYRVTLGWLAGPLNGRGLELDVRKIKGKWTQASEIIVWIS